MIRITFTKDEPQLLRKAGDEEVVEHAVAAEYIREGIAKITPPAVTGSLGGRSKDADRSNISGSRRSP